MNDKISIITVVYNNVSQIEETMLSVLNQKYNNTEYIVIDGQSSDGTLDIVYQYKNDIDIIISEPDKGIYDAMNKGTKLATGDWILYLNSGDCLYDKNTLSNIFKNQNYFKYSFLYGAVVAKRNGVLRRSVPKDLDTIKIQKPFNHQALFSRSALSKAYLFNLSYPICADYDFVYHYYNKGKKFEYVPHIVSKVNADEGASKRSLKKTFEEGTQVALAYDNSFFIKAKRQTLYLEKQIKKKILNISIIDLFRDK